MTPRFLELFSGSQAMADAARDYGWDVLTLDNDPSTHPDLCMDVMDFEPSMLPHG